MPRGAGFVDICSSRHDSGGGLVLLTSVARVMPRGAGFVDISLCQIHSENDDQIQ